MAILRMLRGLFGFGRSRTSRTYGTEIAHRAGQMAYEKTGGATPALREAVAMYRERTAAADK